MEQEMGGELAPITPRTHLLSQYLQGNLELKAKPAWGGGVVIECWPNESSGAPPPAHIHTIYRILQKLWRSLFKAGTKTPSWLLETRGGVQRRPRGHLIFRSSSHSTHGSLSDFLKVSAQTLLLPSLSSDHPLASANQTSLWRNVLPTHKLQPDFYKFLFFKSLALLNWQKMHLQGPNVLRCIHTVG